MKSAVAYERPFWRERGLNGHIVAPADAPLGATADASPDVADGPGVLVCFSSRRRFDSLPARPQERRDVIVEWLGRTLAPAPPAIDYAETVWSRQEWVSGCSVPLRPGFVLDVWPALYQPVGRVHWAGTETAREHCGHMEGAVVAGQRAAAEVLHSLEAA